MELFDLHCDTIIALREKEENWYSESTHFSLSHLKEFSRLCQTMAIFIPDDIRGDKAIEYFDIHERYLKKIIREHADLTELAYTGQEIERITEQKKCAVLLAVESAAVLGGKIENVSYLAQKGVKMMTLTWNGANELASGHDTDNGFTEFGLEAVKQMEREGIIVDASHINDKGFDELCRISDQPFIATHSNLRSVCPHRRNLTERQFKEVVRRKGLVGLNLCVDFLDDKGRGTKEQLLRHVYRMLELGGEDVIACGSDFDGADIHESMNAPDKLALLAEYFEKQGIPSDIIHKIFFDNALSFFKGR